MQDWYNVNRNFVIIGFYYFLFSQQFAKQYIHTIFWLRQFTPNSPKVGGRKLAMEGAITRSYEGPYCSLPYAPLDPQSTHHHLLGNHERQPKSLSVGVVTSTCKRIQARIGRVDWKGMCGPKRGRSLCRQDFPNAPMYIDPAIL